MKTMGRNFAPKMGHSKKEEEEKKIGKERKKKRASETLKSLSDFLLSLTYKKTKTFNIQKTYQGRKKSAQHTLRLAVGKPIQFFFSIIYIFFLNTRYGIHNN